MKVTKNVTIKGTQFGFIIRNNYEDVAYAENIWKAYKIAETFNNPIKVVNL